MQTSIIRKALTVFVALIIGSCDTDDHTENIRFTLLNAINELRLSGCTCGSDAMPPVPALEWNIVLENAARDHARDMLEREYFDHISLDGLAPVDRAHNAGYDGENVGENIARYYQTTNAVMKAWLESESHCKAIMDANYREMGAGKVKSYWVVDFGNP